MTPALACSGKGGGPLGGSHPRHRRTERRSAQSRHQLAPVQPDNSVCHDIDADHFPLDMSSRRGYVRGDRKRPFFCCGPVGPCYKPAARDRPDMMLSAGVAELVEAMELGSSDVSCGGSSTSARTTR